MIPAVKGAGTQTRFRNQWREPCWRSGSYNQAARRVATRTMEIMSGLVGGDSEALDIVRRAMPVAPEEEPPSPGDDNDEGFGSVYGRRR
ncbi:hypothetical protein [Actinokineospora sp. NBRC 105648]|uniref:hypothetical protein n=1 Tax=Actinokineospora sp. NBRC 105648 TaxID=3032206 RepID=UPI0024A3BDBC|nr:hypothetical protein [Actinokineospora sp. NBRC 105648]GLZ43604.1 hypothetical protein Acsp05_72280 [Actinokineospora sp. NBRC 105648]